MALRAPSYPDDGVPIRPLQAPMGNPNAPIEAFGGGQARAENFGVARGLARDAQALVLQAQDKADADRMIEERIALNDWERQNVYDRKTGALGQLGKNALGIGDKVNQDYDKFTGEREQKLSSDGQRRAYRAMIAARKEHIGKVLTSHEGQQQEEIHIGGLKAATASSIERAATDPATAGLESKIVDDNALELAKSLGYDDAMTDYSRRKAQSDLHTQVIDRMLSTGQDLKAKDYYTLNGKLIIGNDAERVGRMVKNESVLGEAQRQKDRIFSTYYTEGGESGKDISAHYAPETEAAAMEEAGKIKDPDVRAKTEELVSREWHMLERSKENAYKKSYQDAVEAIEKSGGKYDAISPQIRDSLRLAEKRQLMSYAKKISSGEDVVTDERLYNQLQLAAAGADTRNAFKNLDLLAPAYLNKLSKEDRRDLQKLQAGLIKDDEKAKKEADGFRTTSDIVRSAIDGKIKPGDEQERFLRLINEKVRYWKADKKTDTIPDKEVEVMVDNALKVVGKKNLFTLFGIESGHWGMGKELRQYETELPVMEFANNIPKVDRDYIISQFKSRGIVYRDLDIIEAYSKLLKDRGARAQQGSQNAGK